MPDIPLQHSFLSLLTNISVPPKALHNLLSCGYNICNLRKGDVFMQLSESKTLENLKTAFANESAAMVRYEIFAEKAKQSGNEEISQVFRTTAKNEKAHAQI